MSTDGSANPADSTHHPPLHLHPQLAGSIERFESTLASILETLTPLHRKLIVVGVGLATCLEVGTTTAVNVILTDMEGNAGASPDEISWVITVYSAAFLAALPLSTWLARRLGHRNHLVLSILLYAAGAFGCFLSHDLGQLLLARAFMGFGGGAFLVRSEATIYRLFQGKQRGQFMLLFGTLLNGSKALTPLAFGVVTDHASWNTAFLLLIPVALAAALIVYVFIPDRMHFNPERPRPDFLGISLFLAAVTAFQVIASRGEQDNWFASAHLQVALIVALISTALFAWWDTRAGNSNPLLNLRLIASERSLSTGLGVAFVFGALLSGGLYVLPQYLRGIQGYSATQTGGFFFVDGLATLAGMFLAGFLLPRWKLKPTMLLAFAFFLAGNFLFVACLTTDTPAWLLCGLLCLHGISVGILLPAVANYLLGQLELRLISFGAAIYLFFRQLGSSLGVSLTVATIDIRETLHSGRLLDSANRFSPEAGSLIRNLTNLLHAKGLATNTATSGATQLFSGVVSTQSRLLSFIDVFWLLQFLAVIGALLLIRPNKSTSKSSPHAFHA